MRTFFIIVCSIVAITVFLLYGNVVYTETSQNYGTLIGTIVDYDTSKPVPARVTITGSDDRVYMAEHCLPFDTPRYGVKNPYFSTIGNTFTIHLPPGVATVLIRRGKEYIPLEEKIEIDTGKTIHKEFVIRRWIDMAGMGWFSGDCHIHKPFRDIEIELLAEDLNVAVPQTIHNKRQEEYLNEYLTKADEYGAVYLDNTHALSVLSEEIERYSGALLFHFIGKEIIPLDKSTPRAPTNLTLIEKARSQGGYSDVEKPFWRESFINIALGKADFVQLANNHFWEVPSRLDFDAWGWHRSELKRDYPEGLRGYALHTFDSYYALLNCGFHVMQTAGSASGVMPSPLGYDRVYTKVEGSFSYPAWFKALKEGESFATNGPMLIMTVNGTPMGHTVHLDKKVNQSVEVICTLYSLNPIERLDIIRDGICVQTMTPALKNNEAEIRVTVPIKESGWIATRCFEARKDNVVFAHTNPVFIIVGNKPFVPKRNVVDYFISRTHALISEAEQGITDSLYINHPRVQVLKNCGFTTNEERETTMAVYHKALKYFTSLNDKSK